MNPDPAQRALTEALRIAAAGYQLSPVTIHRKPDGKKGFTFHQRWRHESGWSSDPQQIRAWWVDHPDTSFALRTGTAGGCDVVDLDVNAQVNAILWWSQQGHPIGAMVVTTPSGGMHLYFPATGLPTNAGRYAPGVDTRGDGGLVIAPGGYVVDEQGGYELQGPLVHVRDLTPLPAELAAAIRAADVPATRHPSDGQITTRDREWAIAACRAQVERLAALPPRTGGSEFRDIQMGAAMMLGRLVEAGEADAAWAREKLEEATRKVWGTLDAADVANIESGLRDGPRKERWRWRTPVAALATAPDAVTVEQAVTPPGYLNLPPEFWQARPSLKHIHDAALARWACPDAVLGNVLARSSAYAHPDDSVDLGIGTSPLTLFTIVYGPPSSGKGIAFRAAGDLLPPPGYLTAADADAHTPFRERPLGTGEGLTESYFGMRSEQEVTGDKAKTVKVRRQVRTNMLFVMDEGESLVKLASRNGSTITTTIRRAWSGEMLGESNATTDRDRQIERGAYSMGVSISFQPDTIGGLFDPNEVGGGTPHRFLYFAADLDTLPEEPPEDFPAWPGELHVPDAGHDPALARQWQRPEPRRFVLTDPEVRAEVRRVRWQGLRRATDASELDGHMMQMRGRVAAHLALLEGRTDVTGEDWSLAGQVVEVSCRVRDEARAYGQRIEAAKAAAADERVVRRDLRVHEEKRARDESAEEQRISRGAAVLARKVLRDGAGEGLVTGKLREAAGRYKKDIAACLDRAVEAGWLVVEERNGGRLYRLGPAIGEVPPS